MSDSERERMAKVEAETAARGKVFDWLTGWRCGAAFLPIPEEYLQHPIFAEGWKTGRTAKQEATRHAEQAFGYRLAVIKLAVTAPKPTECRTCGGERIRTAFPRAVFDRHGGLPELHADGGREVNVPPRARIDWRKPGGRKPDGVIVCSRPGRWGNPWKVSYASEIGRYVVTRWNGCRGSWDNYRFKTMGRTEAMTICLELYRRMLRIRVRRDPAFLDPLRTATGLACYCDLAERCHVDVIRTILSEDAK